MVEVINASSTSLSAVLDHRRAVTPYERTQRQIEDDLCEGCSSNARARRSRCGSHTSRASWGSAV
jgi:hypothetical protein